MAKISQKKLNEFLAETRRDLSARREETEPRVRQNDVDEFLTAFRSDLEASYTQEERDQMKADREAYRASLRPGETRRGSTKTEDGQTISGARWDPAKRKINATVRSADEIRKELSAVDEEIKAAKIWQGNGLVGGSNPAGESAAERARKLSALETSRERLRQELAANRNALKNNADYAEKNQADAGFAAMTDDSMYRLVNYPEQENDLVRSPSQGDIKVNETLKSLIDPIFSAVYNDSQYIKSMTDEERQTYNYLYKTEGRESADEYLDLIKEGLTKRSAEETGAKMEQFAEEHPVLSSAYTVATLPAKGASALGGSLGTYLSGKELDRNASYNALANASSGIRGTVSKQVEEKWGKVGSFAYDVGMSMADFLAMGVIGKGSQIPMMILGSNAAADMTISALERGLSDGKALSLGLVAGIAEAAAEKIGIDRLFKNQNWNKNSLLYILQNVFGEGLEEGGTSLVNSLADILISRDQSEWQQSINAYREQGFTDKEAFENTLKDTAIMIGLDALGGAISGGLMAGGGVAVGKIGQGAVSRENVRQGQETIRSAVNEQRQNVRDSVDNPDTFVPGTQTNTEPISSRVFATKEGEKLEIGREVRRDQLMTIEQQERADAIDNADDLDATAIKYEATPRQRNEARELSDLTGYGIEFFRQKSPDGSVKHGLYDTPSGKIYLNVNSNRTVPVTVGHEIMHTLEGTAAYDDVHDYVLGALQSEGKNIEAERARIKKLYEQAGVTLAGNKQIDADMVAEYVGTELLDNIQALRDVYRAKPSLGQKITRAVDKLLIRATGMQDQTVTAYIERLSAMQHRVDEIVEKSEEEINRRLDEREAAQAEAAPAGEGVPQTAAPAAPQNSAPVQTAETPAAPKPAPEEPQKPSETVSERRTAPQTGGTVSGGTETRSSGTETQEAARTSMDESARADMMLDELNQRYENGEISDEEYDEAYELIEEARLTGRGLESSADIVDYPEGRITEWVRGKSEAIREKLGIKPKEPSRYSISAEEVEDRVSSGRPVEAADEVQWSISNDASYMDTAERENEKNRYVPYNVMAKARDDRETIRKIFTDPSLADSLNLPPENIGNTYIPNGSYDGTEENTTVCIRSMAADALMDAVAEHLGRPLTVEDTITVSQEYWQYTDQPECLYCYVAMDRKAYREFLGSYLEQRNNALADLRSGMSKEEAYRRFLDGRVTPKNPNGTKPMRDRFDSWVRYMENGTEMITEADLASEKSMQDAAARSPELAAQINDARKYAQGASWAKKRIGYTAYNNHILKWTPDRIRKLNSQFGLRLYSFSDFSPAFILENMQMITDASVRGLKMLAYTKDINFAKIFAPSGININISTFAYEGADGSMVQDGMQGADWAEAQAMRDQFENVGITFVAVNDAQVDWAIAQDWIDVVIPFHLVRTGAKVAESFGWKNYTQMSGDVKSADWTKGDKKSIFPAEHQNDRERYFEALRKNHLEPRFRDWADNPNYMKLVNGTRRSAGETPAVQPVFDVDAAKAAIDEMRKRGGYYVPVGKTDENMRDIAGEIAEKIRSDEVNSGIQFSISEDEDTTPYGGLPVKAQNRVRDLERKFGIALDKMFGLGMTYKSPDFRAFLQSNVRPLVNAYLENGIIPEEESDALFAQFFDPATGADESLQKQEFYNAFEEMEGGLFNVARWSQSQTAVPETDREESPIPTTEEAEQLFAAQRDARREMDKVMYRVLLKPEDEVTVGKLLRGELSPDQVTENRADILEAYRVQKAFRDADAAVSVYKKRLKAELYKHVDKYLGNIANWKDKLVPLMYQRETMERNIRDIIPDKGEADAFIAEFITPVHRAEAQRQRFLGEYRERVQKLNLSTKVEKGNQQSEAYAVQFLGEAADNIRILSLSGKLDQQRDGHTLEEWQAAVEAFWAANPNMNRAKIDSAIGEFRQIYNELLPKLNEVRIRNGYAPVAFRQGYFPHFTATSEDTVLARILRPFGIEFNADALPTSINGLTADFKPGITYFQFGNERLGFETTYDALQGYEMYLNAASDVIYHTDNIQKLRALAARIRYLTGDEGIKQQIDKVRNNDTLDEAEKQVQLEEIYRKGRYRMSNFVVTMDEYTNGLANKKSRFDRGVEELFGRPAYSVMKALESRVAANMIAGNIGSALTNIIPLNQANAIIGNVNVLKGMYHTIHGMAVHDGFAAASDFLTNRRGADPLVRTFGQKLSDKASIPMNLIDGFVSETIVRAAYIKNLADGMGEDLALQHADALAASIMADRSKGALPVLFNARNPLMKLFTQFQVEVNNEYSVIFKDIPELAKANSETKAGAIARITGMLFRYFVGAWLFNEIYEKLFGRRAALDPVGMIANTVGSVAEGEDVGKALQTLGTEAVESLPFVGGVLGGGRVPIQSAIPDFADLTMAATSDTWTDEKKALTAFEELSKPAAYLLPPFLGGQIQKTLRGIAAAAQGGVYGIEGDEDGGAYLKYPVYNDPLDVTRSVLFGTTYTEGGQEWVDSGFKSLSVSQTAAYQAMKEFGADDRAAFDLIQEYKSVPTGEGRTAAQRDVIRTADIPGEAKFAAYYNLGASDSRKELMDSIEATEPRGKLGEAAQVLMDISDIGSGKTAGTCDLLAQSGLSEDTKKLIYRQEVSDQKDDDIRAAELVGISFDEYLDAHAAYSTLYNDKTLSKSEQALEFSRYVDGTNLTAMQKETLREIFKFYSQVPVSAKNYNELRNLGISDDYAAKITRAIDALEPLPGKKSVSEVQKARVVVDAVSDPDERLAALGTVLSDSQYRKVSIAADAGLDPEVWVAFREILPEFDSDANGSYTQEEMEDAIRAFSSGTSYGSTLMKQGRNLSRDEMAILWQIGGNWKSANNPFSKPTGKKVKDLLDAEKKG